MHISSDRRSFEYFVLFYNPTVSPSAQECEVVEAGGIKALWLGHHRNSEADIRPGLVVMGHLETKSFNYNATIDFYCLTFLILMVRLYISWITSGVRTLSDLKMTWLNLHHNHLWLSWGPCFMITDAPQLLWEVLLDPLHIVPEPRALRHPELEPITSQYWGHVIRLDQSEASILTLVRSCSSLKLIRPRPRISVDIREPNRNSNG